MPGRVKATAKFSGFEYQGGFADPVFEPLRIFSATGTVYRALKPWNISPQDVKYRAGALASTEPIVTFELAKKHYSVSVAMAQFVFNSNAVAWDQAPVIIEIIGSTASALAKELGVTVTQHSLSISMQLGITGKSIQELTGALSIPLGYPASDTDFFGFLLYTKDGVVFTVDKSAADPNDLFVRIVRKYKGTQDMDNMAKELYEDEQGLANALGIEIE